MSEPWIHEIAAVQQVQTKVRRSLLNVRSLPQGDRVDFALARLFATAEKDEWLVPDMVVPDKTRTALHCLFQEVQAALEVPCRTAGEKETEKS